MEKRQHPRCVYSSHIEGLAWEEVGDGPHNNWLFEGRTKNYKRVGRSRKKLVSYTFRKPSAEQMQHLNLLDQTIACLSSDGVDLDVPASWKWKRLTWAMGVSLVAPVEVRNKAELAIVAELARLLILGKTTVNAMFPGYKYGRKDWLLDMSHLNKMKIESNIKNVDSIPYLS